MIKKTIVFILLLSSFCLAYSQTAGKTKTWWDVNVGGNELYEKSNDLALMTGYSHQVNGPYFASVHISLPVWTSDFVVACDLQGGREFEYGHFCLYPAIGIGYAKVGYYASVYQNSIYMYDEIRIKGTVSLPINFSLQYKITKQFGLQAAYTYNINNVRSNYGLYGGIIFGRLR